MTLSYFADSSSEHTAGNTKMLIILPTKRVNNYHSVNFRPFPLGISTFLALAANCGELRSISERWPTL
jgi:hypothetical protein